jgi:ribonuclease BN (tRNA processing enzyme)
VASVRVTIVGCSGSFPGPDSPASCYLLEADGFRLLLDLGNGALGALQRYAGLYSIDAVCLSHLHGDHCLDLASYMVARTYAPDGARPPVPVYGPEDTPRRMAGVTYGGGGDPGMAQAFEFVTLSPGTRQIGPFEVALAHMNHPVETFGFRFSHAGASLAYSADTGECPALVDLARGADLLLCEASLLEAPGLPVDLHLTARKAAEHAERAGVAQLTLTHLVPWNDRARSLEEASVGPYRGPITLATAGQSVDLG